MSDKPLPAMGDWDAPIFGELGVLLDDGDRVQCHACGKWFANLGSHVNKFHQVTADEYRAIFGLRSGCGLVGPTYAKKLQSYGERFAPYREQTRQQLLALSSEERSARMQGRISGRLQERVKNKATRQENIRKAIAGLARARKNGTVVVSNRLTPERARQMGQAGGKARKLRMEADPAAKQRWQQRISDAQGGGRWAACPFCSERFRITSRRTKTCGRKECRRKQLSLQATAMHAKRRQQQAQ